MAVSVPLPHDLGHDDRLLLPEFCDLPLHHVVPHLFGAGSRLLPQGIRNVGHPACTRRDPGRVDRRLRLGLPLSARMELNQGSQDLLGRPHADVFRNHLLGVCSECQCGFRLLRPCLCEPCVYGCCDLVAPRRRRTDAWLRGPIGGIQNFASNLAGIVTTTYLFIIGNIEPLPARDQGSFAPRATPAE